MKKNETITLKDFIVYFSVERSEYTYSNIPTLRVSLGGVTLKISNHAPWGPSYAWDFKWEKNGKTFIPTYHHDSQDGFIFGEDMEEIAEAIEQWTNVRVSGKEIGTII